MKPNITQRRKARSLLVQALYQWQIAAPALNELEAQFRAEESGKVDWRYFHEALRAIVHQADALDNKLLAFIDRDLDDLTPVERAILRLGMFELSERIDVPFKVVINEYVDLAKTFGAAESHKYVNGVLDKAAQELRQVEIQARQRR